MSLEPFNQPHWACPHLMSNVGMLAFFQRNTIHFEETES